MKFRVYGLIKDSKTSKAMKGVSIKLYLEKEELQKGKSVENGFYELVAEIDDSRIESGQQLSVTVEKEGFEKQEHRLLATEGSFNLDVKLETASPSHPKPYNLLPVIIAGGAVILLLIIGIVVLLLLKHQPPKITNFTADPNSIELGQTATLRWNTENVESVEILIDKNVVTLAPDGNRQVQPTQTTKYQLIAKGKKGEKATESQVVVVEDVVPPKLTITLSPSEPTSAENVTFTAKATDPGGIRNVEIYVNNWKAKECKGSPCSYTGGPYPVSRVRYYAYAYDKSGNMASTDPKDITVSLYKYHQYYSFESVNYPTHYIRHRNSLGEITKISSTLDKKDATFKIVPGLADSTGISFESLNYPGRYLRHQNYRIKLHPKENSLLFIKDATFHVKSGLADSRSVSFES